MYPFWNTVTPWEEALLKLSTDAFAMMAAMSMMNAGFLQKLMTPPR